MCVRVVSCPVNGEENSNRQQANRHQQQQHFLEERLAHIGWTLVWEKSISWIPGMDLLDEISAGHAADRLLERVPRSRYGIKVLASAADGDKCQSQRRREQNKWRGSAKSYRSCFWLAQRRAPIMLCGCFCPSRQHASWTTTRSSAHVRSSRKP